MIKLAIAAISMTLLFDVCGYRKAGKGASLPAHIKTLAVPVFQNTSLRYRVEQRFTAAVVEEVLKRARGIRVVNNPDIADAVLLGDIRNFRTSGALLDDQGRIRVWEVSVTISVTVRDLKSRKLIYSNPRISFDGEYELSNDPASFFNEENPAVDRIARQFAQSIVSTIMEGL